MVEEVDEVAARLSFKVRRSPSELSSPSLYVITALPKRHALRTSELTYNDVEK